MITKTKTSQLAAAERDELLAILAEARGKAFGTSRFHQERDALFGYLLLTVAGTFGIVAFLVVFGLGDLRAFWSAFPGSVNANQVAAIGFHAAVVITPWAAWRLVTRWHRTGAALTSYGFVKVRGNNLRVVRFSDITRVVRTRGRRYAHIEIATRDGGVLGTYAGSLYDGLAKQLPPECCSG
jgi:hypothetical protein